MTAGGAAAGGDANGPSGTEYTLQGKPLLLDSGAADMLCV